MREDNAGEKQKPIVVEYRNPGVALPVRAGADGSVARAGRGSCCSRRWKRRWQSSSHSTARLKDERERQRVARNGYQPERKMQTGIGDVPVKQPRVRAARAGEIKFSSNIASALSAAEQEH